MKRRKVKPIERKYAKPVSLYPLKPEEAISAIMKVNPKKLLRRERKTKEGG